MAPIDQHTFDPAEKYFNRELSWIEFNRRVLEEAKDERHPLLERVKFVAIFGSNLDEFFMTRVGGIKQQIRAGVLSRTIDGMTPKEELIAIHKKLAPVMTDVRDLFRNQLLPLLHENGIHILDYEQLSEKQKKRAQKVFKKEIFPVLTPLAFDPGRPFPHISNLSLNLAVRVQSPRYGERFARLKVPSTLPRIISVDEESSSEKNGDKHYVWLEQIIVANIHLLFTGLDVLEAYPFRVTRNADVVIQEEEASDLLQTIEAGLRQRHFGSVVRLTVAHNMPEHIRELLRRNLEIDADDIFPVDGHLGLRDLMSVYSINRPDLKDEPFVPATPPALRAMSDRREIFDIIKRGDILLHHPYDSFMPTIDLLKAAANDPDVLAIKQTLYRVGRNSPIVHALMEARENEKEVAVLVELKARFDEESNIGWARALERVGVHVVYGLLGLKTHSKITLIVRKEADGMRRYLHLGTGNYNAVTAQIYTDLALLTCDDGFGEDASHLFNYLTGYSNQNLYKELLIAPVNLRERMREMIHREIAQHQQHGNGCLIFKMNSLTDPQMIDALYEASQAGVQIDLLVRGISCLRPGVPGLSDNIRVTSVVGRFLEHPRIYYFHNGGDEEIYLGSADLMTRNLSWRVETVFPVKDPNLRVHIRDVVLGFAMRDNMQSRLLHADGRYERLQPDGDDDAFNSQLEFLRVAGQ